jgi:hypothetical protein
MALPEGAFGGLADGGERRREKGIQFGPFGEALAELGGARAQGVVGERLELGFEAVYGVHLVGVGLNYTLICCAEYPARQAL